MGNGVQGEAPHEFGCIVSLAQGHVAVSHFMQDNAEKCRNEGNGKVAQGLFGIGKDVEHVDPCWKCILWRICIWAISPVT